MECNASKRKTKLEQLKVEILYKPDDCAKKSEIGNKVKVF
jgi:hypothetical protein